MLTSMRKPVAKVIMVLLFGLLILSFAVWGIGDILRGPGASTSVAEVGDIKIDQRTFSRDLSREMRRLQGQLGQRLDLESARALGIDRNVLQLLINRALFDQKAADLGMVVSDDVIKARILQEPAFKNQFGEFDRNRFVQALRNASLSEDQYLASLSRDIRREQLASALTGGSRAPEPLLQALFTYTQELRAAEVIVVEAEGMTELPEADEQSLVAFHEANAAAYMAPETRSLALIYLRPQDLVGEMSIDEGDLQKEFEDRREDFIVLERRSLEQVLFSDEAAARSAKERVDGGADFAEVAQETAGGAPLDLGTVTQDELALQVPELAEPVFAVAEGGISDPVESSYGWHLVRVGTIEAGKEPGFEEVRAQLEEEMALNLAVDSLISIANQLDDELGGEATLEEAAATLNLEVTKIAAIDQQGRDAAGQAIDGLPPAGVFLPIVAETAVGEDSLLVETPEGGYFVLRVEGETPAEVKPLDEVRDQVVAGWQEEQRDKLALERAETLAERAREGVELAKIAEDEGIPLLVRGPVNRFGEGSEVTVSRDLVSKLFELEKGDITTARESGGHAVAKLVDINRPDPGSNPEGMDALRAELGRSLENDLVSELTAALGQVYVVSINRRLLEDLLTGSSY